MAIHLARRQQISRLPLIPTTVLCLGFNTNNKQQTTITIAENSSNGNENECSIWKEMVEMQKTNINTVLEMRWQEIEIVSFSCMLYWPSHCYCCSCCRFVDSFCHLYHHQCKRSASIPSLNPQFAMLCLSKMTTMTSLSKSMMTETCSKST